MYVCVQCMYNQPTNRTIDIMVLPININKHKMLFARIKYEWTEFTG